MIGPVQVLAVALDGQSVSDEILAEFTRLRDAGIVALVDLLLVERAADGTFETLPGGGGSEKVSGSIAAALLGHSSENARKAAGVGEDVAARDSSGPATWSLADAVPPGCTAAVALIEHRWAAPLMSAMRRAATTPLEEAWLAPADIAMLDTLLSEHRT